MLELGARVGKQTAHEWIYEASMHGLTSKIGFADAMRGHRHLAELLGDDEIARLTDPAGYLGECGASVDRVLAQQRDWLGV
jgi:adenylosuccinate lyase